MSLRKNRNIVAEKIDSKTLSSEKFLKRILYFINHKLRSPIVNIQGLINLANQSSLTEKEHLEITSMIGKEVEHLDQLTRIATRLVRRAERIQKADRVLIPLAWRVAIFLFSSLVFGLLHMHP